LQIVLAEPCAIPTASTPAMNETLWRSTNNIVILNYSEALAAPDPIEIRELLDGGAFGPDLSGQFSIDLDPGDASVVRVKETGEVLADMTWYAVMNGCFEMHFVKMVGDCNNDGRVLAIDVSCINPHIPCFSCPDARCDINGDDRCLAIDVSVTNTNIPTFATPAKPSGH
jgi:hypothetical protein